MKKKILQFLAIFGLILLLNSCGSPKKIIYFQDIQGVELKDSVLNFEPLIQIGDLLFINVSATDGEAALPFNLFETPPLEGAGSGSPLQYLVNIDGDINFPILGKVDVEGYSSQRLSEKFERILAEYINNPIINIRITNFRVSVLGEVRAPGSYEVPNERISIIEAIGLAGDLTIFGERKTILLIREVAGQKQFVNMDLTNKKIFNSPYYYLNQNDVVYVRPNKQRINGSTVDPSINLILSLTTFGLALYSLFLN